MRARDAVLGTRRRARQVVGGGLSRDGIGEVPLEGVLCALDDIATGKKRCIKS